MNYLPKREMWSSWYAGTWPNGWKWNEQCQM